MFFNGFPHVYCCITGILTIIILIITANPMLTDYQNMTTANLVDLLAQETQKITQFMMDKEYGKDYEQCKQVIQQLQAAIAFRRGQTGTTNDTGEPHFTQGEQTDLVQ